MKTVLRFSLALLAFAAVGAVAPAAAPSPAAKTPKTGDVAVTRATLANGLRIVVLHDTLAPVVSTWMNFQAGSDDEPITGIAHAQEHMFYRGSTSLSGAQADEIAGFTGDEDNADTQNEITQYFHTVPAQDLTVAMHLDVSRLQGLLDSQKDWNQERGAIEQEVTRDNSDASYRLYVKLLHHLMAGTPYADEGLGTMQSFSHQIEATQLRAFFSRWYHPNNAIYVIAGDVDPAVAIADARRIFGPVPRAALPAHRSGHLAPLTPATYTDDHSDASSTSAIVAYRFPGYADPDFAPSVLLVDVLNSHRAELYNLVARGRALAAEADVNQYPQASFLELVSSVSVGAKPLDAIGDLKAVIDGYRKSGIPPALIAAAKEREVAQAQTAADSIEGLAGAWSETLAVEHRTPPQDIALLEAVKPGDVDRVLRKYLVNATASIAYAVPKNGGGVSSGGAGGGEEAKPEQTQTAPLPAWAETALHQLKAPASTIAPTTFTLQNGLKVVVQRETASSAVVVAGTVLNSPGLEEPAGLDGISDVVEKMLPFGTRTYSRLAYQTQLDRIAATVNTGFEFSLDTLATHFDRGMQLLADDELHPALSAKTFAVIKDEQIGELTGEETSPDRLTNVAVANDLYPAGDPARRFALAAAVRKITLADARAYYRATFRPDLTTIAIVGDVTPAGARASVQRWFGNWTAFGTRPAVFPPAVPNNAIARQTVPATGRIQDTVHLEETLGLTTGSAPEAPLEIANAVLSGDFSSILIRDLRVTTGYVYFVGSALHTSKTRSTFELVYGCDPKNVGKAEALAIKDLQRMQTTPLDSERLLRAKSHLLAAIPLGEASYDGLARHLAALVSEGLPLNEDVLLARREYAATPASVAEAMRTWIRPDGFVRIVEGPAPQ